MLGHSASGVKAFAVCNSILRGRNHYEQHQKTAIILRVPSTVHVRRSRLIPPRFARNGRAMSHNIQIQRVSELS